MRVLITGGSGFIGSHLAHDLTEHGHDVVAVDKEDADLSLSGMAELLIGLHRPEYVVHLAARYGRLLCRDEPHRAVTDNAAATTEIAAACAKREIPVLYTSSSEVYGDHHGEKITEDSELRMPTTIYGLSKRWGEETLHLYLPDELLCVVGLNMLYGPQQRAGYGCCALATFIDSAQKGQPFTVHPNTTRSWLYISDAVKALRLLIEGGHTGTFNCSNNEERIPTTEVAELVCEATGASTELIELAEPPPDQIKAKNYDCSKLRKAIGWKPQIGLRDGIRLTIGKDHHDEALQGSRSPAGT